MGFPGGSVVKNPLAKHETNSIPWWVKPLPPGEGNGNPLQYSCLGNPMDRGAWLTAVHGVVKGRTGRSDFHSLVQIKSHDGTNSNITHQG